MNDAAHLSNRKKRVILVLAVFLVLIVLGLWRFQRSGMPKDRELIALFREHKEAFEKLRVMALDDAGRATYLSKATLSQSSVDERRREQYRQLLEQIRNDLVVRIDAREVSFSYSAGNVGLERDHSWMKGIAYLPNGAEKIGAVTNSLDGQEKRDGVYFVPIEGNWYLTYVQLD
jgi:hypothetical protein